MKGYAIVFFVAFGVTLVAMVPATRLSRRWGFLALPDHVRHLHERPTPVLGGPAMCLAVLGALLVASRVPQFHEMFSSSSEPIGVAIAAVLITGVGVLDDVLDVSPPAKMAGQVLAASALYLLGVTMYFFRLPFLDTVVLSRDLAPLVTVIWVVGMANAINFIDGVDGLAAGVVAIGAASFFLYADRLFKDGQIDGRNIGPLLAVIACGVCLGFLPWNWHPAKIFMGDSGAMLLGLLMAASTMVVGGRAAEPSGGQTYFFLAPLLIPFFVLGVPVLDTLAAIIRRTREGGHASVADRRHVHHRLQQLGHGPRRTTVILWSFALVLSGLVLALTYFESWVVVIPLVVLAAATALFAAFPPERGGKPAGPGQLLPLPVRSARSETVGGTSGLGAAPPVTTGPTASTGPDESRVTATT